MTPWPDRPLLTPPLPWPVDDRPAWLPDPEAPLRRTVVEQVVQGDVTATRWEITEHPAVRHYPERATARAITPAPPGLSRRRWPIMLALAAGAAAIGGVVWLAVTAAVAVVHAVAAGWPVILGGLVLLGLLARMAGGGCSGLHCGGCRRH